MSSLFSGAVRVRGAAARGSGEHAGDGRATGTIPHTQGRECPSYFDRIAKPPRAAWLQLQWRRAGASMAGTREPPAHLAAADAG
jgi:hypothetical protein